MFTRYEDMKVDECASLYQISSKSVKLLQRYSDNVFENSGSQPSWDF